MTVSGNHLRSYMRSRRTSYRPGSFELMAFISLLLILLWAPVRGESQSLLGKPTLNTSEVVGKTTVAPEVIVTTKTRPELATDVAYPYIGEYIPNWFVYRKHYMGVEKMNVFDEPVKPEDGSNKFQFFATSLISKASKITHIYYAFWDVNEKCVVEDIDPDASWYGSGSTEPTWINIPTGVCKGLLNDMMALKNQFPHLKLLISLGGWTYSQHFSKCSATAENRDKIWRSFDFYLRQMDPEWGREHGLWDGADFDWEFPEVPDGLYPDHGPDDWDNYVKLIAYFKQKANEADRPKNVLTSAIGIGNTMSKLAAKPNVTKDFCDVLDHVLIMTYDIHGKWSPTTGHNANFCSDPRSGDPSAGWTVLSAVDRMTNSGCPHSKLSLGLPAYSQAWTRIPSGPHNNGLFSRATSDQFVGWSTFSDSDSMLVPQGILSFWDVKDTLARDSNFVIHSINCPADSGVVVPLKHIYNSKLQAFASYEDEETVRQKVRWAHAIGLGGFFLWDAQHDRDGILLNAAIDGWGGAPIHNATGTRKCFDERKIDYSLDPLTGEKPEEICQFTNHEITFAGSLNTCYILGQEATRICEGRRPRVIGGSRPGKAECLHLCSESFGPGTEGPWLGDKLYFACDGDVIPPPDSGGGGGAPDCKTCDKCIAVPGNNQGVTDEHCAPCARGGQSWWPCNLGPGFCQCAI